MNTSRQIKAIQTYVGVAALIVIGFSVFAGVTMWRDLIQAFRVVGDLCFAQAWFAEEVILSVSIGATIFACALCGYFLLRAVSDSRLHAVMSGFLFVLLALSFVFIPPLLMFASQIFRPDVFRSDSQMNFFLAPLITSVFLLGLLIAFVVSLFFCRHSHAKPGA
jgi:hypothetical protein